MLSPLPAYLGKISVLVVSLGLTYSLYGLLQRGGKANLPGYLLWDPITCYYLEEMLNISAPRAKQPTVWKHLNFWRDCFSLSGIVLTAHGGGEGLATLE